MTDRIHEAARELYTFLHKVVGDPNDPNALLTISAEETTAVGFRNRLCRLGEALGEIEIKTGDVYARPECIFEYCPTPETCKQADQCRNVR